MFGYALKEKRKKKKEKKKKRKEDLSIRNKTNEWNKNLKANSY
jgi:hypothetical protein